MTFEKEHIHNKPLVINNGAVFHTSASVIQNQALQIATNLIQQEEGLKLKAYLCSANVWTVGYGHAITINGIQAKGDIYKFENLPKELQNITQEKANELFQNDLQKFFNCVYNNVSAICNANQIAALTSLCYNIGIGNFQKSTLLANIKKNPHNLELIQKNFLSWRFSNGKPILLKRRQREWQIYIQ